MLYGTARITAIDPQGHNFVDDVGVGDLWHFALGVPHSIQGLNPDGCEFLLVFDDGDFDEDNTFLLSDWFKHTPNEVLSKNFGVSGSSFAIPDPSELYIFAAPVPGALASDKIAGATPVSQSFSHKMLAQQPIKTNSGTVRITDTSVFPASKTISAALVEVQPGGMREMHWHPNTDDGSITLKARSGSACSPRQVRRALSISWPVTSVTFPSRWGTTSRIPEKRHCASLRYSRAAIMPTCRSISGWR